MNSQLIIVLLCMSWVEWPLNQPQEPPAATLWADSGISTVLQLHCWMYSRCTCISVLCANSSAFKTSVQTVQHSKLCVNSSAFATASNILCPLRLHSLVNIYLFCLQPLASYCVCLKHLLCQNNPTYFFSFFSLSCLFLLAMLKAEKLYITKG